MDKFGCYMLTDRITWEKNFGPFKIRWGSFYKLGNLHLATTCTMAGECPMNPYDAFDSLPMAAYPRENELRDVYWRV